MIDTSKMNTKKVLEIAKKYAQDNKIMDIVIATTTGETGVLSSEVFNDKFNLIAVTHSAGFGNQGKQELLEENKSEIRASPL